MKTTTETMKNHRPEGLSCPVCCGVRVKSIALPLPEETRGERAAFAFLVLASSIALVNALGQWAHLAFN
jgi:hypothetical protein